VDWLKEAKQMRVQKEIKQALQTEKHSSVSAASQPQDDWVELILKRIQEVSQEGFFVHVKRTKGHLELYCKGKVEIGFEDPSCISITYRNVSRPSVVWVSRPISVYHHRVVKVREMNARNREEVLKFVVLGMERYCKIAKFSRIELNLQTVSGCQSLQENV